MSIRVRFAPSPTGFLHIGGARTALFNYLYARRQGGTFILRIEDTDQERSTAASEEAIYAALAWLGLDWDEGPGKEGNCGPYRQSERREIYRSRAMELVENGKAYPCFCPPDPAADKLNPGPYAGTCRDLDRAEARQRMAAGEVYAIRFRLQDETVTLRDELRGDIRFDMTSTGDQILIRRDGFPTYNFACVVDDAAMQISDVIRGDDHLSNTPKQVLYYRAIEAPLPRFTHVSMILGADGERLSKRHGATSVEEFRERGIVPEALVNFLALLGWSAGDDREFFSLTELQTLFDLQRVATHAAVFNEDKLRWMNARYLRQLEENDYLERARPHLQKNFSELSPGQTDAILRALRNRVQYLGELRDAAGQFLHAPPPIDRNDEENIHILNDQRARQALKMFRDAYAALGSDDADPRPLFKQIMKEAAISGAQIYKPLRLALAGVAEGPGILDLLTLLGRHGALQRMDKFLKNWEEM